MRTGYVQRREIPDPEPRCADAGGQWRLPEGRAAIANQVHQWTIPVADPGNATGAIADQEAHAYVVKCVPSSHR
jgi:hypothetical protein